MQKSDRANSRKIVFSQWSRKSYAVFASLHKVIKIAQLSVDICKTSLIKKTALIRLINLNADDNITDDDKVFDELQDNQQFLQLLPVVVTNSDIAPKQENNIHYNNGKPIFCKKQSMGFLF